MAHDVPDITVRLLRQLTCNQKASAHIGKANIPTKRLAAGVLCCVCLT